MNIADIKKSLLRSYGSGLGINHLDGANLPSEQSINTLAADIMHVLFPGFFEDYTLPSAALPQFVETHVDSIHDRLSREIEKTLRFSGHPDAKKHAENLSCQLVCSIPELRSILQTDLQAAYDGDPAARSLEEIILAYPCVLVISLQRVAHVLHKLGVPIIPRMITEYAHERTGADIHPGAEIGTHFFIDHCTGVVIGETTRIGNHVKIYQGVTLGAKSFELDQEGNPVKGIKRHPDIGNNVTIYSHATILGGNTRIGDNCIIGANVWLLASIPNESIAHYRGDSLIVRTRKKREEAIEDGNAYDLEGADWSI